MSSVPAPAPYRTWMCLVCGFVYDEAAGSPEDGLAPGTLNLTDPDPACGPQVRRETVRREVRHALNNSFGFGGSNCSLLFARDRHD